MPAYHDPRGMFARLLALNREAFDAGSYTTAYHALATALHAAYVEQDAAGCARVALLVGAQLAVIDATAPAYAYSTAAAHARGHASIFTRLAEQAHAMRWMLSDEHDAAYPA
jgi:hypothetical protein